MRFLILAFFLALVLVTSAHPTVEGTTNVDIDPAYDDWNITESHLLARVHHDIHCTGETEGKQKHLEKAIKYLRKTRNNDKAPYLPAGRCQTAACADETKIKWCNDDGEGKGFDNWDPIADGAQVILDNCVKKKKWKQGWLGHNDHWTVYVQKEDCYMQPGPGK